MAGMQTPNQIEDWYRDHDPWGYETNPDDIRRRSILLSELPRGQYQRVLDIGCGEGFVTHSLPGNEVLGIDVSLNALSLMQRNLAAHRSTLS
jgi:SAM-dependent methyltransferase